jgi:hypothetical protein
VLAAGNLAVTCGPAPPSTETCEPEVGGPPADIALTSIEIGSRATGTFEPFVEDGVAHLQIGGQGSPMVVAVLRLRGSGVPACLPQFTAIERLDGTSIVSEAAALPTHVEAAGTWYTNGMFLVYFGESGIQARMRTVVAEQEYAVRVWIDHVGTIDAGVAPPADAP